MPAAPRMTCPCRLFPDHAAGLAQTARMSGSGNGLPNRGNDLLCPAGQRGSGRSIRRSAMDETGRAVIQHGAGELVDPLLDGFAERAVVAFPGRWLRSVGNGAAEVRLTFGMFLALAGDPLERGRIPAHRHDLENATSLL
jgi:hypothetical protein